MGGSYSAYVVVNGCTSSTASTNVVINNAPSAPAIGSNSPICVGGTLNLSSNTIPGATYVWSGPNGFSSNAEDPSIPNATSAMGGSYSAYVVVNGCTSSTASTNVVINNAPSAPAIGSNSPICVGATLNLSSNTIPGATYVWSGPNGFSSNAEDPSIPNATSAIGGSYSAYVVVNGCTSSTASTNVVINNAPSAPAIGSNSPICVGGTLNLSSNTIPGATYVWSGPNGFSSNAEDPSIPNATSAMGGSYSAYVVVNGCTSSTASTNVVINNAPSAPAIGSNSPICEGGTLNLSSNTIPGATYVWSGPNGFSSNAEDPSIPNATTDAAGNYSVYIVVAGCTSSVSSLTVQITPPPTADFAITPQVCLGDDAFALYNGNAPQNATYTWTATNGGTVTGNGQGPITINWNIAGNQDVTLEVTINGCNSGPNTQTVNVIQPVIPNAGPDQSLCSGESITLGEPAQNGVTYQWLTPNGILDPTDPNSTGTWTNNGNTIQTYTLTLQAQSNGCTATDETVITVIPNPSASFVAPPNQCLSGNSFSFTAGGTYLPQATFAWSFANANPAASALQNPTGIQFTQSGIHDVSLTVSQLGCTSTFTSSITVSDEPIAGFSYQPGQGCIPLTVTFTDQTVPTASDYTYNWNFGDGETSNTASPVHTYTQAGVFDVSLTVTNAAGCQSTYTQNGIIKVYNAPVAGFSANPQTLYIDQPVTTIIDGSVGNVTNWTYLVSDGSQFNSPNFTLNFQQTGTYTITQTVSDGFGCEDQTTLIIEVLPVSEIFIPSAFTPGNDDNINEVFKPIGTNLNDFKMYIYNRWGEIIFTTMDINEGWNGNIRNSDVQAKPDVYLWMIEYLDHKGIARQKHGRVTVVR
jgi:gliding motility-associated-like protein